MSAARVLLFLVCASVIRMSDFSACSTLVPTGMTTPSPAGATAGAGMDGGEDRDAEGVAEGVRLQAEEEGLSDHDTATRMMEALHG